MIDFREASARATRHSPFLAEQMRRFPEVADWIAGGAFDRAWSFEPAGDTFRARIRRRRGVVALCTALGDLSGHLGLEDVVAGLSSFADIALDQAIGEAMRMRIPDAPATGFSAIGLGKHGSRELNYSSDIDPILLFDPATMPVARRDDPGEVAVRIARSVVDLLQTPDADGYVLRVDLRLRPASEATPLAIPVDAAIGHYESSALAWERAAFIRARAVAGDTLVGQRFLDAIRPFVWRRSVDFGAVQDLRALSHRIRAHHSDGQSFGPGYDLKRARGGIREVEFYIQIHQLIHGGRDPSLQVPDTLGAAAALAAAGRIDADVARTLSNAYRLYRTIEHRLQMVDDRQTHTLPGDGAALDNVAQLHGLPDGEALIAELAPHIEAVGRLYDELDGPARTSIPTDPRRLLPALGDNGFVEAATVAARIAEWRGGRMRALRSDAGQAALEKVLPQLVEAFGRAPDPDAALHAFDSMLGGLPTALNLFRLLEARPGLLVLLVDIMSHAPTLADALGQTPALLDRLLDASARDMVPSVAALTEAMTRPGEEIEPQLDWVRRIVNEHRFALGVQVVEGSADALAVGRGYARVAEAAVAVIADATVGAFARNHGRVPGSELLILALGRLGGGALTHASDLDLIYLFTGDFADDSDGPRPLGATHYYNRLGARLTAGLSVPTSAGSLYEVDTRLRPSGGDGPLVVSLDSFARYQANDAWTWEHMALSRARPVYGGADARDALQAVIDTVLARPRDRVRLVADIVSMRADMTAHKPPAGPLDVKMLPGGLVDLEFVIHFHQLATGTGLAPDLPTAISALVKAGLVEPALLDAHDSLTRMLVTLRLLSPRLADPGPATRAIVARACGAGDWERLIEDVTTARHCVSRHWDAIGREAV